MLTINPEYGILILNVPIEQENDAIEEISKLVSPKEIWIKEPDPRGLKIFFTELEPVKKAIAKHHLLIGGKKYPIRLFVTYLTIHNVKSFVKEARLKKLIAANDKLKRYRILDMYKEFNPDFTGNYRVVLLFSDANIIHLPDCLKDQSLNKEYQVTLFCQRCKNYGHKQSLCNKKFPSNQEGNRGILCGADITEDESNPTPLAESSCESLSRDSFHHHASTSFANNSTTVVAEVHAENPSNERKKIRNGDQNASDGTSRGTGQSAPALNKRKLTEVESPPQSSTYIYGSTVEKASTSDPGYRIRANVSQKSTTFEITGHAVSSAQSSPSDAGMNPNTVKKQINFENETKSSRIKLTRKQVLSKTWTPGLWAANEATQEIMDKHEFLTVLNHLKGKSKVRPVIFELNKDYDQVIRKFEAVLARFNASNKVCKDDNKKSEILRKLQKKLKDQRNKFS